MTETKKKSFALDFTKGSIIKKILAFSLPLMATNLLQLLFNAADMIVVSIDSDTAMGSIGATTTMVNIILQLFTGLAVGSGVIMARCYGAKDESYAGKVLHTSMVLGVLSGVAVALIGLLFSKTFLELMGTPEANLRLATQYLAIYFLGSPFNLIYNFGASALRSVGDTKRPLVFLTVAGVVNVGINLVAVLAFHLGVAGVAIATVASQAVSAILVVAVLFKNKVFFRLRIKDLKIDLRALKEILGIGIPSGVQGMVFSLSNAFIQSAINSFGTQVVNGNSAAVNLDGIVYTLMNSATVSCVTAVGQNYGAKNFDRIKKTMWQGTVFVVAVEILTGGIILLLYEYAVSLFVSDPVSKQYALNRSLILLTTYWTCGIMEVISGTLRGMGYSIGPMILVILGTCVVRVGWIVLVFPHIATFSSIFVIFPISWVATGILLGVMLLVCWRRKVREYEIEKSLMEYKRKEELIA